jgi:hypothetical protein
MKSRLYPSLLLAAAFAVCTCAAEEPSIIKFSDPSKPGTIKISLGRGELQVTGADVSDVTVKTDAKSTTTRRKDGMRVISAASSYALRESGNIVTLDAAAHDFGRGSGDFKLVVPRNTNVIVQNAWGGDITCSGISGDLEIICMHGEIRLDDVAGGAVVSTMHGEIRASIRELREGKPLSFASNNGEVVLRVSPDAKANIRLRTQNGSVLTDFEETALVTKTENSPGMPRAVKPVTTKGKLVLGTEVQEAIREAAQIGATAVKEALEAVKQGLDAAKLDNEEARQDLEKAKRDLARAKSEMDRERNRGNRDTRVERDARADRSADAPPAPAAPAAVSAPGAAPKPPTPPSMKFTLPTISGGKLVTGTLNGGGPEISVSTMNGDVVLRKLEKK